MNMGHRPGNDHEGWSLKCEKLRFPLGSSADRRQIAREQASLNIPCGADTTFNHESAHALDEVTSKINPCVSLCARVICLKAKKCRFWRDGKRHLKVREQNIVSDSGHPGIQNKYRT